MTISAVVTKEAQTALMVAIRSGHFAVAKLLIENWGAATHLADHVSVAHFYSADLNNHYSGRKYCVEYRGKV